VASTKGGRWSRPDLTETNSSENWGRLSTADRRLLVYGLNGVPGAPVGAGSVGTAQGVVLVGPDSAGAFAYRPLASR